MRRNLSLKNLLFLCLAGFLITGSQLYAQNDYSLTDDSENDKQEVSENTLVDEICEGLSKEGGDPKLGSQKFRVITLKATNKKIYVPLWYNEEGSRPEDNPDPFRPKIQKEIVIPKPPKEQVITPQPGPKPPVKQVIPPLKIFVKGIVGNEGIRYAVIVFENEERTVVKDQIVDGKFKVVDIYSDRIVVYSNREERRYTFKIGGEEK